MTGAAKPMPLSLRRKSSARLAFVQCLYRLRLTGETLKAETLATQYLEQWRDDKETSPREISKEAEPDNALLRKLLAASEEHQASIEKTVRHLSGSWTAERLSPLLYGVLAGAVCEMRYLPARSSAMIIDEYVTLAKRFFDEKEAGFVNAFLDNLVKSSSGAKNSHG